MVLTQEERTRLAPFLARVRTIRAELAVADQEKIAAAALRKEAKIDSGWRDRSFGGRLSREPARADTYRNARRAWTNAAAASSKLTKRTAKLEQELDRQITPMMPRLDPRYQSLTEAVENYDRAMKHCRNVRRPLAQAIDAARTATKAPGRYDKDRHAAVSAGLQYPKLIAQARRAAPDARLALYSISQNAQAVGGRSPHVAWDAVQLDALPSAVDDISTLRQLARTQDRLDRAIHRLRSWRAQAAAAQQRAVPAVRELLINDLAY
jgi:hypothetical protein